jgi:hypothetical protein
MQLDWQTLKKQLANASIYKIIRYFYLLTIVIILVAIVSLTKFLYGNFYETLTQAKKIEILRNEVPLESVNLKQFEEAENRLNTKLNYSPTLPAKDPFSAPSSSSTVQ